MNKKKHMSGACLCLIFFFACVLCVSSVLAEPEMNMNGLYEIYDEDDLRWLAGRANIDSSELRAILMEDIILHGSWTPVGSKANPFCGTLDGNGHTVSGFGCGRPGGSEPSGFFGYIGKTGVVRNLILTDSNVEGNLFAGGICANNAGTVEACVHIGSVICSTNEDFSETYTGGICGINTGIVRSCTQIGNVGLNSKASKTHHWVGGICGLNTEGTVINCAFTGDLALSRYKTDCALLVSGICPENSGRLENCFFHGSARLPSGQQLNSKSIQSITITNWNTGKVIDCYVDADVAESLRHGLAVTMSTADCTNGTLLKKLNSKSGTGLKTWITAGDGYPALTDIPARTDGVYLLTNEADLRWYARLVNNCGLKPKAKLTADITVTGTAWAPIGTASHAFDGVFDGQVYTISGLNCAAGSNKDAGLFGYTGTNAVIRNVGVLNAAIGGSRNAGVICGVNQGRIENCYARDSSAGGSGNVGGLCGTNKGTLNTGYASVSVTGGQSRGGIAGANAGTVTCMWYDLGPNGDLGDGGLTTEQCTDGTLRKLLSESRNGHDEWKKWRREAGKLPWLSDDDTPLKEDGWYLLENVDELFWFANYVNGGQRNAKARLMNDITVNKDLSVNGYVEPGSARAWTPIRGFSGIFDGNGHTVKGIYISANSNVIGFFGDPSGSTGEIRDLQLSDSFISGCYNVGGIAGYSSIRITGCSVTGSTIRGKGMTGGICGTCTKKTVESCTFSGNIEKWRDENGRTVATECFGGICGVADGAAVTDCTTSRGLINGPEKNVGGICGKADMHAVIENCRNGTGVYMSGPTDRGYNLGGVCGLCDGESIIRNCVNTGYIQTMTEGSGVGGICGKGHAAYIVNCANSGNIFSTGDDVGGICGNSESHYIENCFNCGAVEGHSAYGGICGGIRQTTVANCFSCGKVARSNVEGAGGVYGNNDFGVVTECWYDENVSSSVDNTSGRRQTVECIDGSLVRMLNKNVENSSHHGAEWMTWKGGTGDEYPYLYIPVKAKVQQKPVPKTGDSFSPVFWILLTAVSLTLGAAVWKRSFRVR